ncbi:hypothetical protein [Janthinobacterium sp. LB2P10]|uniref:hypothetical protein n=1 Tax=Janthinobacterium sp. LB2P10 TaxID=3424194 RepID=UPI003F244669
MSVTQNYKTVTFSFGQAFAARIALEDRVEELKSRCEHSAHWTAVWRARSAEMLADAISALEALNAAMPA